MKVETTKYFKMPLSTAFQGMRHFKEICKWNVVGQGNPNAVLVDLGSGPVYAICTSISNPSFMYTPGQAVYDPGSMPLKPGCVEILQPEYENYMQTATAFYLNAMAGNPPI